MNEWDTTWWLNGEFHRVDGPAREWADGCKAWYLSGVLHRVEGPAVEWANGDKKWYLNGIRYAEREHNDRRVCKN